MDVSDEIQRWIESHVHTPMDGFESDQLERTKEQYFLWSQDLLRNGCSFKDIIRIFSKIVKSAKG